MRKIREDLVAWMEGGGLICQLVVARPPQRPHPAHPSYYLYTELLYPSSYIQTISELLRATGSLTEQIRLRAIHPAHPPSYHDTELFGATGSILEHLGANQSKSKLNTPPIPPSYISLDSASYLDLLRTTWS